MWVQFQELWKKSVFFQVSLTVFVVGAIVLFRGSGGASNSQAQGSSTTPSTAPGGSTPQNVSPTPSGPSQGPFPNPSGRPTRVPRGPARMPWDP
jgi:hypothetical protein